MTDDLTKAYSSIYNKEEESKPEQVQEVVGAAIMGAGLLNTANNCLLYTSPSPRDS